MLFACLLACLSGDGWEKIKYILSIIVIVVQQNRRRRPSSTSASKAKQSQSL